MTVAIVTVHLVHLASQTVSKRRLCAPCSTCTIPAQKVTLNGQPIRHEPHPVYFGVTLGRTLNYKQHPRKIANKVKSRNSSAGSVLKPKPRFLVKTEPKPKPRFFWGSKSILRPH